jgi:hypothetical protein
MKTAAQGVRGTAFGLEVHADLPIPVLEASGPGGSSHRLDLRWEAGESERLGVSERAEVVCHERDPSGHTVFQIERERGGQPGYLIWGPEYGASLISDDGSGARTRPGSGGAESWQRLLVAQVIPFAAVLQGLEVLHASAVVSDGAAIALVGRSGAGKTATAMALCRRGARFLADDVLALEQAGGELIAHPGAPVAFDAGENQLDVGETAGPAALAAVFFLDRRPDGPDSPRFEPAADPRLLMSATFNTVLLAPRRLRTLLEVSAAVGRGQVERVIAGPSVSPDTLASAIEARTGAAA